MTAKTKGKTKAGASKGGHKGKGGASKAAPKKQAPTGGTPYHVEASAKLHGEIIAWEVAAGTRVPYATLLAALEHAELDPKAARELCPRHAFARACRTLADNRIIRNLDENNDHITFQFTREEKQAEQFRYDFEAKLTLNKATGKIDSTDPGLARVAQEALDTAMGLRKVQDVTRVLQSLFRKNADLFPIKTLAGVYFVPERHQDFLAKVEKFMGALGGMMRRFPVPSGTAQGDRSVKEAVAEGLQEMVTDFEKAVDGFDVETRDSTLERAAERVRVAKFKVEAYAEYLAGERERLLESLEEVQEKLVAKVRSIGAARAEKVEKAAAAPMPAAEERVEESEEQELPMGQDVEVFAATEEAA